MNYGHIPLDSVPDLAGVVAENTKGPGLVKVLTRALLTSDEPEFYTYLEQLTVRDYRVKGEVWRGFQ
jgi:hypothetical protein